MNLFNPLFPPLQTDVPRSSALREEEEKIPSLLTQNPRRCPEGHTYQPPTLVGELTVGSCLRDIERENERGRMEHKISLPLPSPLRGRGRRPLWRALTLTDPPQGRGITNFKK